MRWNPFRREAKGVSTLELFREIYGGKVSTAGKSVTWRTALDVTTVLACTRVIAHGVSQVPLKLMRVDREARRREDARDHPLFDVLHRRPNPWMTSFELREMLMWHLVLCGNAYCWKNEVRGRVVELLPFEPGTVQVRRESGGELQYDVRIGQETVRFPAAKIWHVRGPSWNGWMGLQAVDLAREAIGLAMSTEEHQAKLHVNGVRPGGVLSIEGTLKDDQYAILQKHLKENMEGSANAMKTLILDRNAKWHALGMTGADAQLMETRRYQVEEVCRAFNVIMVGHADKTATYASAEQMFLAHVVHTLSPWYERLEQSIDANLLTADDRRDGLYVKFVEEGLLRGALKDTADYLTRLTDRGVITRNEARGKLDLNPLPGLDEPLTPANMNVGAEPAASEGVAA